MQEATRVSSPWRGTGRRSRSYLGFRLLGVGELGAEKGPTGRQAGPQKLWLPGEDSENGRETPSIWPQEGDDHHAFHEDANQGIWRVNCPPGLSPKMRGRCGVCQREHPVIESTGLVATRAVKVMSYRPRRGLSSPWLEGSAAGPLQTRSKALGQFGRAPFRTDRPLSVQR